MSAEDEIKEALMNSWQEGLTTGLETARAMVEAVRAECLKHLVDSDSMALHAQIAVTTGLSESLLEFEAEVYAGGWEAL